VLANMMNLHLEMRRFVNVRIGDGEITNAWEDSWLSCGPLSTFTQYRFMYSCSFTRTTSVRHLLDTFHDGWPDDWTNCFPLLPSAALPFVDCATTDVYCWDIDAGGKEDFSVQRAYFSFIGPLTIVP